jgi:hypothetical protein
MDGRLQRGGAVNALHLAEAIVENAAEMGRGMAGFAEARPVVRLKHDDAFTQASEQISGCDARDARSDDAHLGVVTQQ